MKTRLPNHHLGKIYLASNLSRKPLLGHTVCHLRVALGCEVNGIAFGQKSHCVSLCSFELNQM